MENWFKDMEKRQEKTMQELDKLKRTAEVLEQGLKDINKTLEGFN